MNSLESAERLRKLADIMEANPEHVNMEYWIYYPPTVNPPDSFHSFTMYVRDITGWDLTACGWGGCVAGWAVSLWGAEEQENELIYNAARRILGLTEEEAELFHEHALTPQETVAQLRVLANDREQRP